MKVTQNKVVSLHYVLTDDNGTTIDSSRKRGEPFSYLHGFNNIISGLEAALEGHEAGFKKDIHVAPSDGYGEYNTEAVFEVSRDKFPENEEITVGMRVQGESPDGVMDFTVVRLDSENVILDANHPMAGQTLHFDVELLDVRDATTQEIEHGHVHTGGADH